MKVINFEEWKSQSNNNSNHLKISKRFEDMNDLEIRLLLEKVVERLNFSIDHLYKSFEQNKETYKILDKVVNNQNNLIENTESLNRLAKKHTELFHEQARALGIIKK
ncbi:hypothetical protein N7U66_04650 [Lacinutrix neustonica]|uniref:Uncharacterized protein n=1 Tax=Lacinutrix neustonica TaxID=2980107 RepID=A0A9E8MX21_9FLAO|nr:hypothetical protein [Lacinutrix neustonica]WAC02921.1 hypothetical protein N7U66_04650 [Lacinutrix neustonica]